MWGGVLFFLLFVRERWEEEGNGNEGWFASSGKEQEIRRAPAFGRQGSPPAVRRRAALRYRTLASYRTGMNDEADNSLYSRDAHNSANLGFTPKPYNPFNSFWKPPSQATLSMFLFFFFLHKSSKKPESVKRGGRLRPQEENPRSEKGWKGHRCMDLRKI